MYIYVKCLFVCYILSQRDDLVDEYRIFLLAPLHARARIAAFAVPTRTRTHGRTHTHLPQKVARTREYEPFFL